MSIRPLHGHSILCFKNVIILSLSFVTRLLSVFFKCLLGLYIFYSFSYYRSALNGNHCVVSFLAVIRMCSSFYKWICHLKEWHWMCLFIMTCFCILSTLLIKLFLVCLVVVHLSVLGRWSLSYCAAVMGVTFICLLFLVNDHPIFVTHTLYDWSLWSWSPLSVMVPWVYRPHLLAEPLEKTLLE